LAAIAYVKLKSRIKCCNGQVYLFDEHLGAWVDRHLPAALHCPLSYGIEESLVEFQRLNARTLTDQDLEEIKRIKAYICMHKGMKRIATLATPLFTDKTFGNQLDSVTHLLGVKNGVVDLRTGKLRKGTPEDLIHGICPVEYDEGASPDVFHGIVLDAMGQDEAKARYLQKLLGYGITGDVSEEIFVVFTGQCNCYGKHVTRTLSRVLGPLFCTMNPSVIGEDRRSKYQHIGSERAKIFGARIAHFNGFGLRERLKTKEVLEFTGTDGIIGAPKYRGEIVIQPRHLSIISMEDVPVFTEADPALADRMVRVHFGVETTDDVRIHEVLSQNGPSVLKWLVEGAVAWHASKDLKKSRMAL